METNCPKQSRYRHVAAAIYVGAVLLVFGNIDVAQAQGPYQPFGVDAENLDVSQCNHNVGCPFIDLIAQLPAPAQWMRLFAIWHFIEPQQDSFDWGEYPFQVWYAQTKGINTYFTATWAPAWAKGADPSQDCPPYAGGGCGYAGENGWGQAGYVVTNSGYTWTFFYNLALQFNGSDYSGCGFGSNYNAATCRPLVQYFGVWNEPNGIQNFDDTNFDPNDLGNYLNDFETQYLSPAYNGVKWANPSAYILVSEIASTSTSACGGFGNCGSWYQSWVLPLARYFSDNIDVLSVHGYSGGAASDDAVMGTAYYYSNGIRPIWLTETAYGDPSQVTTLYDYEQGSQNWWPKAFYSMFGHGTNLCSNTDGLICSNDGVTWQQTPGFFSDYHF